MKAFNKMKRPKGSKSNYKENAESRTYDVVAASSTKGSVTTRTLIFNVRFVDRVRFRTHRSRIREIIRLVTETTGYSKPKYITANGVVVYGAGIPLRSGGLRWYS